MKKILIVDDEPMMLKIAERSLRGEYETILASSGEEAISLFVEKKPDMVISDLKMPGMSGYELQDSVKQKGGGEVPFIFMTADENDESETQGRSHGAADYIRKPVKPDVMLGRIAKVFENFAADKSGGAASTGKMQFPFDTGDTPKEKDKLPEWVLKSPLLDYYEGLDNSDTAEELLSAIDIFLEHADANLEDLQKYHDSGDIASYTIKVHALKSTARIVGAMRLSSMAASLEKAGNEENKGFIDEEHDLLIKEYRKYIKLFSENREQKVKTDIDPGQLKDAVIAIREYAAAEDFSLLEDALDYLERFNLPKDKEEMFGEIQKCLYRLDWDKIHDIMEI